MLAAAHPHHSTDAFNDTPVLDNLHDLLSAAVSVTIGGALVGITLAAVLTLTNRRGTFALIPATFGPLVAAAGMPLIGWTFTAGCVVACGFRERWRLDEIKKGGDKARKQRNSVGVIAAVRNWLDRRIAEKGRRTAAAVRNGRYPLGIDKRGKVVWMPIGGREGRHSLVVGATRAGKTNTVMETIAAGVEAHHSVVVIDPKGDPKLPERLRRDIKSFRHREFLHFTLDGESDAWNPLGNGTPSERADKLIGAEEWTEPHYKRLYQRYLLAVFTAMEIKDDIPDLQMVVELLHPDRFALYLRDLPELTETERLARYVGGLTADETRDLAGLRNRLALLVEGEHGHLLTGIPRPGRRAISLLDSIPSAAVIVFSLNSSRSPETAKLLGAAIFQDLKHVAGVLEREPWRRLSTTVVVDEFGSFGSDHVLGLFQRAASAKLSLTLITQELADLQAVAPAFRDQVLGNVETVIAHRQSTPDSAELVAELAGTDEVWIHTWQTDEGLPTGTSAGSTLGSKRRGREFHVAPDTIKRLQTGEAIVITKNPHAVHQVRVFDNSTRDAKTKG